MRNNIAEADGYQTPGQGIVRAFRSERLWGSYFERREQGAGFEEARKVTSVTCSRKPAVYTQRYD